MSGKFVRGRWTEDDKRDDTFRIDCQALKPKPEGSVMTNWIEDVSMRRRYDNKRSRDEYE